MEPQGNEKAYYTDIAPNKSKDFQTTSKPTEKNAELPPGFVTFHTSKTAKLGKDQKELLGDETFNFEKSKLHQLQIEGAPVVDVNDDTITKLKKDIFERFQEILVVFERNSGIIRVMSVLLLFVDILEMIGMFFLLLYMSLRMVPSEQILFWVGSALILCLLQMFMLIKIITATQSKDTRHHWEYIKLSICFLVAALIVAVLTSMAVIFRAEIFSKHLKNDAKETLKVVQGLIMIATYTKVVFQIAFIVLEARQITNLSKMSGDEMPPIETQPTSSQRPLAFNEHSNNK